MGEKFLKFHYKLIYSPLEGRVRIGVQIRMDGPMSEKFASSNATTPSSLIDDVIKSESAISNNAHMSVCPVIIGEERTENVENLINQFNSLTNIFKEKIKGLESLRNLSFDDMLTRLSRQNDMQIVNSIADFLGLGIPKICQVNRSHNKFYKTCINPANYP